MSFPISRRTVLFLVLLLASAAVGATRIEISTRFGSFQVELFEDEAPTTVQNFLNYVERGDYEDSFLHRIAAGFVIQGGGFTFENSNVVAIETDDPIPNEFSRSNTRGTIAMAKVDGDPDSATSQWFINLTDNPELDEQNGGFTVFGEVVGDGMSVVDSIVAQSPVWGFAAPFGSIPLIGYSGSGAVAAENLLFTDITVVPGGQGFEINTGVAGSYFNVDTAGQGWLVDVIQAEDGSLQLFVAWFTYDTGEPPAEDAAFGSIQHRWFTAQGPVQGDTAELGLFLSTGGVFNDPRETTVQQVGTLTMRFTDCTNAVISYAFTGGPSDEIPVIRLSPDVSCQSIADGTL